MNAALRQVRLTVVVSVALLVVAIALLVGASSRSSGQAPATTSGVTAAAPPATDFELTSSGPPQFANGLEARMAAEGLIAPYIESQYEVSVTDMACSEPPTGAEDDEFVCYGLKPGDLVIALRATIGPERLITLDLISDQQPATSVDPTESTAVD